MSDSALQIITEPVKQASCPKCGMVLDVTGLEPFTRIQCPQCKETFEVPAKFGGFLLLKLLGMGGMGGVYRAQDEGLKREVALKVIQKAYGNDPKFIESFQHEAQAAAKLNHPHIAQIYSFGQVGGQPYIAMELVSGGSLDKMMASGPVDPTAALDIGRQIAEGLSEATAAGLVHGDVKPENILFDKDGGAKLVDFGIAAMHGSSSSEIWGTPYYIAPEKVQKLKCDQRADIYSLGATIYHAIAGVPPFDGPDATAVVKARFAGPAKPLKEVNKETPDAVNDIVMRMLELDPRKRYPTYDSLLTDMKHYFAKAKPVKHVTQPLPGKRIVIKGKHSKIILPGEDGKPLPDGMVPIEDAEAGEAAEEDTGSNHRGCKLAALIVGGTLLTIVILVTTAILIIHSKKVAAEKDHVEKFEAARAAVFPRLENSIAEAKKLEERTASYLPEAKKYADEAGAAALAVFGDGMKASLIPAEPPFTDGAVPSAYAAPAAAAPAPAPTNAVPAAPTNAVPAAATNAASAVRANKNSPAPAPAATNAAPAAAAAPAAEPAPAADDPAAKYPVIKTVAGIYADYYYVRHAARLATAWRESLEDDLAEAKKRLAAVTIEHPDDIATIANALIGKYNDMNAVRDFTEVARKVAQMKKALDGVKVDLASIQAERKDEAAAKARSAAKAAEEAKAKAAADAEAAKAKKEAADVAAIEQENVKLLKQGDFRGALRALRDFSPETDGGNTALSLARNRVKRVEEFHAFLVKQAPKYKSARGWSVAAADPKFLTVGSQKIKWGTIYETRSEIIFELVGGLVMAPQATKEMRIREKARLFANAALVLSLFYPDQPAVIEHAKKLAKQAVEGFEPDAEEVKALLPAFFKE